MQKYWVKNYLAHGIFPEEGQKQKTEKKKEEEKRERAKVGDNNGQATHGARKHAWRTQAAWANNGQYKCMVQNSDKQKFCSNQIVISKPNQRSRILKFFLHKQKRQRRKRGTVILKLISSHRCTATQNGQIVT